MFDRLFLKILLAPISLLFGIGVLIRNLLYATGLLKGVQFSVPVIGVGNLTVGGAGKTPHTEYLIRLLKPYLKVATLSRGYGRNSKGFVLARAGHTHEDLGDEPLQYKLKFPDITVAVSESRALGIPKLMQLKPETQVVLLDDAYQHRSVQPGLQVLLTEYHLPYTRDYLMPSGRLREWRAGASRADIIVVTKCPPDMPESKKQALAEEIDPGPNQRLFFSCYRYFRPYSLLNPSQRIEIGEDVTVMLVCAIARTQYLLDYLHAQADAVKMLEFEDHHAFNRYDLEQIEKYYINTEAPRKIVLTTEKDAIRLAKYRSFFAEKQIPVFVLPIEVAFLYDEGPAFDEEIRKFLLGFRV